jgi:hypothetical protein
LVFLADFVRQEGAVRCLSSANHIKKLHAYLQALIKLIRKNGAADSAVCTCFFERALARGITASGTAAGSNRSPARLRLHKRELPATTLVVTVAMYSAWWIHRNFPVCTTPAATLAPKAQLTA